MAERNAAGHVLVRIDDLRDRLWDRWIGTNGMEPRITIEHILEDMAALGCERAGAMLERERRRPTR